MTIVDDFEDGNINEYGGNTNDFSVNNNLAYNGTYGLVGNGDVKTISATDFTVQQGEQVDCRIYFKGGDTRARFYFATQSETSTPEAYYVEVDKSGSKMVLRYDDGSGGGKEAEYFSTSVNPPSDEWLRLRLVWKTNGEMEVTLFDAAGNSLAFGEGVDTTLTSGGIGWHVNYGGDTGADLWFDYCRRFALPAVATNLSASASGSDVDLTWNDNAGNEDGYRVYRSTSSQGDDTDNYSLVADIGANSTSYTDTSTDAGTTYYYRVAPYNSYGEAAPSNEASVTTDLTAPSNVSATVNANDSIDVSWTDESTAEDFFTVEVSRDGTGYITPKGGNATPSSSSTSSTGTTYTENYGPSGDSRYDRQVGIDSTFKFRVRAETSGGSTSAWAYSGTVYTDPLPPHNPSVSRPDGDTIDVSWTNQSDIEDGTIVDVREDTGSGYGSWFTYTTTNAGATSQSITVNGTSIVKDARYQIRLIAKAPDGNESNEVFADYGNQNNVFFEDDFESGDLSKWDTTNLSDADSGVVNDEATPDTGISGSEQGSYHLRLDATDSVREQLGDLSGESDVIVKAYVAVGSMDDSGENGVVEWYDGSSWQQLRRLRWEYNEQGWVEVTALVPDSYLSTNNFVRFRAEASGGGDHYVVDRVVVSDLLHEYTTPTAPSGLSLDTSVEDEITASWTDNAAFEDVNDVDYKRTSDVSWVDEADTLSPYTIAGLDDGERYGVRVRSWVGQYRNGSKQQNFVSAFVSNAATTILPAPTSLSYSNVTADGADLSWTDNHDYGHVDVEYKPASDSTWQTADDNVSRGTGAYSLSGLRNGEQYDARVLAATEHTRTEDN